MTEQSPAEVVHDLHLADPAAQSLGITLDTVEPGQVSVRMTVTDRMCNGHGVAHGGFLFALADTAFAFASRTRGDTPLSTHAVVDFLAPARVGWTLTATASERYRRGAVGIYDVSVEAPDGEVVAEFRVHGRVPRTPVPATVPAVRTPVHLETRDGVTHIVIDNPPVNCLDRPVRGALLTALEDAEHDPGVRAVVVSGRTNFSAGADLAEFDNGQGLAQPSLHKTISDVLDGMTTPVIAAISGVALGGGLELALACHYRLSTATAMLGLPETTLGFMPGAGGTQRLPRAVGIERAANLILTGRRISGAEAKEIGLVDNIVDDVDTGGHAFARAVAEVRPLPRLRDRTVPAPVAEAFLATVGRAIRRDPHAPPGARCAVEAMAAASGPFDAGMERELRLFNELAGSAEARAFRYGFLSDRRAGRVLGPKPPPVEAAAVIGAGTMGRGIALALMAAGIRTRVVESDPDRLTLGLDAIAAELNRAAARGRISGAEVSGRLALLSSTCRTSEIGDVDLVIEAIFEDLEAKRSVFAELDSVVKPDAVLASNTSSLDLNRIAAATEMPERVVGLHFFSPADRMRLVEVVEGRETAPAVLARAGGLVRQLGKIAVIAQVGDGFIGNRIMDQYVRQAMLLLRTGGTPRQIDEALESWGMAMGPFRVLDIVGNDIPWQARRARYGTAGGGVEWELADELCRRGWLGRKSGRGWYDYPAKGPGVPNPELPAVIAEHSGNVARQPTAIEIVERCVYALVNEAAAVLADGVAARPTDIDVVFRNGYGFPATRGGPLFHADIVGLGRVVATMRRFAESDPFFEPHPLLVERARRDAPLMEGRGHA